MRYFLDTEFIERGPDYPIQLLSLGIVAQDGRELYMESADADRDACNDWVKANVLPHLNGVPIALANIATYVTDFIGADKPEFWGYYADYDWVVFCQMFGSMINLPKGWPMYCRDLKQLVDQYINLELPKQSTVEHNALNDARWNAEVYQFLTAPVTRNFRAPAPQVKEQPASE